MSTFPVDARCVVLFLIHLIYLPLLAAMGAGVAQAGGPNGASYNGALTGAFSVSPMGAATYSIPLDVPPGIGGLTPKLALNYSSQSGNGQLGIGWSLAGLSAITRCPATLVQDGFIDPVDYDASDRYCLDGQRLIEVSNSGCSGGTEYRTEIDSYARICAYGTAGVGSAWFKVWTKAGLVVEYANSADSRIEAQNSSTVTVWAANRIEDAVGNYLTMSYFEDNVGGEYHIERIAYTGNATQGMSPYHSVQFVYENRNDTVQGYIAGALLKTSVRLNKVQVFAGDAAVRDYRLVYAAGAATGRSRLASLQQCDGVDSTAQCLPETSLTWSEGAASFDTAISTGISTGGYSVVHPMDVNGDGRHDLVSCKNPVGPIQYPPYYYAWQIVISTETGFNAAIDSGIACTNYEYSVPIDYDTDGKMDLLVPYANSRWYVLRSTGAGFSLVDTGISNSGYTNKPVVLDVNGDGRDDVALAYSSKWYLRINNGNGFNSAVATGIASTGWENRLKIDYDSDGMDDLLVPYANSRWYVLRSTGVTFQLTDTGKADTGYDKYPQVMDVDGDGRQDLVLNGSKKNIYFNRGNGFTVSATSVSTQWASATLQLDYNGDGKMDLAMPGSPSSATSTTWYVLQSTGTGFSTIDTGISTTGISTGLPMAGTDIIWGRPGDYNGDGFVDLALDVNNSWSLLLHSAGVPDQLKEITEGAGIQIDTSYKPLTDSSVYTVGASSYPQLSVHAPIYVVSSTAMSNGVGGSNSRTYSYTDARVDLQGRGFLGFRTTTLTDQQAQMKTSTTYSQTFPYVNLVESSDTRPVNAATPYKTTATIWNNTQPYTGVYQARASSATEHTYELDATLVSTVLTSNSAYDAYGNPGQTVVMSSGGGESYSTTTLSSYDNDTVQWRLGRLLSATVTSSRPSGSATRSSSFEYDAVSGLLNAEIIEPNNPQLLLRTEYTYDGYGNKTSVIVKDSGSTSYPITTTTSTAGFNYNQLSVDGTYVATNTNAKGHVETQVIDARYGKVLSLTGPNGLTTQWQYDSFGRQIKEVRADATETSVSMFWCDSTCAAVANAAYQVETQVSGAAPISTYYDNLGRELRTASFNLTGETVYKDTEYNALGQVARVSRPYVGRSPLWTDYGYDAIGRAWKESGADGGIVETAYNGLSTHVRRYAVNDAYDQTVTRITNVVGNLVQVTDASNQTTRYEYDPFGNLTHVIDPANNVTVMSYDLRGRKTAMDDPDMGHWEYQYDALGQLRWQKDAKSQIVTLDYDVLGRMTSRVEPEGTSTWSYDQPSTKGIGKAWKVTGPSSYSETYAYDALGRPSQITQVMSNSTFTTSTGYDAFGRVNALTYPSGFQLKHAYNSRGHLEKISNAASETEVYWTAQEASADGQITSELLGNGVQTVRTFDPSSGRMTYLGSFAGTTNVQMLTYTYDALGNLQSRADAVQTLNETFEYDALNRLAAANVDGIGSKTWDYDGLGNIKAKDGYTDYSYGTLGSKPHAVLAARGNTYSYDANGNMQNGSGRTIIWNGANLPARVIKGSSVFNFSYAPDRTRYKQASSIGGVNTTTLYVGKLYEKVITGTENRHKHYIYAGSRVVAIREQVNSAAPTLKYLHQDHLGSTDVITDATGQVLERQSFDAFGARRVATDWSNPVAVILGINSSRGYTGHEQFDGLGLIHMNGRVYDPALGRFLSADPFVQAPGNAQSLNRYGYAGNNPLSYTDPSGYFSWSDLNPIKLVNDTADWVNDNVIEPIGNAIGVDKQDFQKYVAPIVAVVIAPWAGLYVGTTLGLSTTTGYALSGFTAGFIASGGDLKAGVVGAVTAVGFYGIESMYGNTWSAGRVLANSTVGGASSVMQGGTFEDGFKMNFATSALTYLNYSMRDTMIGQSKVMACSAGTACNSNGVSSGLRGDGFKLAGARQLVDSLGDRLGLQWCKSTAGGCQGAGGQAANLLGFGYSPGDFIDSLTESFAGPHDWLRNQTGAYDLNGNSVQYSGGYGVMQDYALNYGLLVPAAPIAAAGLMAEYPGMQMLVGSTAGRW